MLSGWIVVSYRTLLNTIAGCGLAALPPGDAEPFVG
jgi:hypothetical protein